MLLAILLTTLSCLVFWVTCYPVQRLLYAHIPGPFGFPIIGNIAQIMACDLPVYIYNCQLKYGKVFKFWFGSRPWVVIGDPEIARRILYKFVNRPDLPMTLHGRLDEINNSGLVFSRGQLWRTGRKAFESYVINSSRLASYCSLMDVGAQQLVKVLESKVGQVVDIWETLQASTLQLTGTLAFGVDMQILGAQEHAGTKSQEYGKQLSLACRRAMACYNVNEGTKWTLLLAALHHLGPPAVEFAKWVANALPDSGQAKMVVSHAQLFGMLEELIADWNQKAATGDAAPLVNSGSFLGYLLSAHHKASGDPLTDVELVGMANTMILAASDTTGNLCRMPCTTWHRTLKLRRSCGRRWSNWVCSQDSTSRRNSLRSCRTRRRW